MDEQVPTSVVEIQSRYATPALVLGILSLVLGGCFVIGFVLGIIGLLQARRGKLDLQVNPHHTGASIINAGQICSIIGIVVGGTQAIFWSVYSLAVLLPLALSGGQG